MEDPTPPQVVDEGRLVAEVSLLAFPNIDLPLAPTPVGLVVAVPDEELAYLALEQLMVLVLPVLEVKVRDLGWERLEALASRVVEAEVGVSWKVDQMQVPTNLIEAEASIGEAGVEKPLKEAFASPESRTSGSVGSPRALLIADIVAASEAFNAIRPKVMKEKLQGLGRD
ncbi:hypothetical protein J5N97_010125 [Dioscorea zingiberensis]|uniref:Uncharacterized protein n=1 Tax=Dioscorea zingiberensis TaxID=325984 RepID=A0A9D5HM63_9LILI|nr:hypothetical protein J5N97_010125 [Dioscorea zingiberensis]